MPQGGISLLIALAGGASEAPLPPAVQGYGVQLVRSLLALAAVCFAAWATLRWAARRGLGTTARTRRMRVLERTMLDARHALYLVEVGGRVLLLGTSERSLRLLAEFEPGALPAETEPPAQPAPSGSFVERLSRLRARPTAPPPPHDDVV